MRPALDRRRRALLELMGNKFKTHKRKYFFPQHVHSLRNSMGGGGTEGR